MTIAKNDEGTDSAVPDAPVATVLATPPTAEAPVAAAVKRRLRRPGTGVLLLGGVLLVQALLTLVLRNTAFEDEAMYIYAGHREAAMLVHGTPTYDDYWSYFSGVPYLYPMVAAPFDTVAGLSGVRFLSLLCMLWATCAVWSTTRRLYGGRPAVLAAALFAASPPVLFLSWFATYDAMAIALLALAMWLVVRTANARTPWVLLAAVPLVMACGVKYASALFVPTVIGIAALARLPRRQALRRALVLGAGVAGLLAAGLAAAGPGLRRGFSETTSHRLTAAQPFGTIVGVCVTWGGFLTALALIGIGFQVVSRPSGVDRGALWQRRRQILLATVLATTALLPMLYQIHLQTTQSLHKHIGFGLMFASPPAGYAVSRISRLDSTTRTRRLPGLALGVCLALGNLALGVATQMYQSWPNSKAMVAAIRPVVDGDPRHHYLAEEDEVPRYYLQDRTQPYQWSTTFSFSYTPKTGGTLSGLAAYRAALADHYFALVILDHGPTAALDDQLEATMRAGQSGYHLVAAVAAKTSHGPQVFEVWESS